MKTETSAKEAKRRADNVKRARQTADNEFPNEKWKKEEKSIFVSPNRKTIEKELTLWRNLEMLKYYKI